MYKRKKVLLAIGIGCVCGLWISGCGRALSKKEAVVISPEIVVDEAENIPPESVSGKEPDTHQETVQEEKRDTTAEPEQEETQESLSHNTEEIAPEIRICMVGDILLHDRVEKYALQEDGTYRFDSIFAPVQEEIGEADLAIVNQEVIIGGEELGISGYPCFNAPFAVGDALVDAGFDVVCHGTNHALDKGKQGLLNCLEFWEREYPGIAVLGINETAEDREEIYIYEQQGMKIAVLNYTYGTNGIPLPEDMPFGVNLLEEEAVIADLEKAESLADFTIVCPHWGTEYVLEQTGEQERLAKLLAKHGADLVLGTHPHVIEPVELVRDEETGNEMLVYYSLGNFVNWTGSKGEGIANRMVGGMAEVTLTRTEEGEVEIKEYGVTALVTHLEGRVNGVYTTKLEEYSPELARQNEIIAQDPAFSYEYCVELCDKVWGDLWREE